MAHRQSWELPNGAMVHTVLSDVADGDFAIDGDPAVLADRRQGLCPRPWTWLHQVHGNTVVLVRAPGEHAGCDADASVTTVAGAALAVQVADCAAVVLWGARSDSTAVVAAVHAGWKGLETGVLERAVAVMRAVGATEIDWSLGPCISAAAYEFGAADLDRLAERFGPGVRGTTDAGRPALDIRAAVAGSLAMAGVIRPPLGPPPACTATSGRHFSHRARGDAGRQVGVIWWEPAP